MSRKGLVALAASLGVALPRQRIEDEDIVTMVCRKRPQVWQLVQIMNLVELKEACRELGLPERGREKGLRTRLMAFDAGAIASSAKTVAKSRTAQVKKGSGGGVGFTRSQLADRSYKIVLRSTQSLHRKVVKEAKAKGVSENNLMVEIVANVTQDLDYISKNIPSFSEDNEVSYTTMLRLPRCLERRLKEIVRRQRKRGGIKISINDLLNFALAVPGRTEWGSQNEGAAREIERGRVGPESTRAETLAKSAFKCREGRVGEKDYVFGRKAGARVSAYGNTSREERSSASNTSGSLSLANVLETPDLADQLCAAWQSLSRPRQIPRKLVLMTCYLDMEAVREVLKGTRAVARLQSAFLFFNRAEAFRHDPSRLNQQLCALQEELKDDGLELRWFPVDVSGRLWHSKAYGLVLVDGDNEVVDGVVAVSSGNLTRPGMGLSATANGELVLTTANKKDVQDFWRILGKLEETSIKALDNLVLERDSFLKKYALLTEGRYFHKWSLSLKAETTVRFKLSEAGQSQISGGQLQTMGFEVEKKTASRQYLDFSDMPRRGLPKMFLSQYGIETPLGWWVPRSVAAYVEKLLDSDWREFNNWFAELTSTPALQSAAAQITEDEKNLRDAGFLDAGEEIDQWGRPRPSDWRSSAWQERVAELRNNDEKLKRFHRGVFDMLCPLDVSAKSDIESVYEELIETIHMAKKRGLVKKEILGYHEIEADIGVFRISAEQTRELDQMFSSDENTEEPEDV